VLLAGCGSAAPPDAPSLRGGAVTAGVAVQADRLDDAGYAGAVRLFGSVTAENDLKWDATEPEPGRFTLEAGERIARFAQRNGLRLRGHALVWHAQLPAWVQGTEEEMVRHIEAVAGALRGQVDSWDVVNEALDEDGSFRPTPFLAQQGPSYLVTAFRAARRADPGARLVYNDYGAESPGTAKGRALPGFVRGLLDAGAPVDAIGFQTHAGLRPIPGFERQLRRIAALGVDVELTEVDVRVPDGAGPEVLAAQARAYRRIVRACLAVRRCRSITFWGVGDGVSWIPQFFPGFGRALLLDEDLQPKPAYTAVREELLRG